MDSIPTTALPPIAWPFVVLALVQVVDGLLCIGPVAFVRDCLIDVRFPRAWWPVLPPVNFAAAAGLVLGLWVPWLTLAANVGLVAYFLVAIGMHLRARDFGRNLFVNAFGMLVLCSATLIAYVVV